MYAVYQSASAGHSKDNQGSTAYGYVQCASFWEKVYAGVQEKINETTGLKKSLMLDALRVGREHNITYLMNGKSAPFLVAHEI